jgi:hypothetical protein
MTWPTTPIDTQHLDSGADSPAAARPALNTMAQNVNSMVNLIDPAGVSQGDTLVYSNGEFVPTALTALIGLNTLRMAVVTRFGPNNGLDTPPETQPFGSAVSTRIPLIELSDVNSIVSTDQYYSLVLTAGTYLFVNGSTQVSTAQGSILIANKSNPTSIATDLIDQRYTQAIRGSSSNDHLQADLSMVRVVATTESISYWLPQGSTAAFSDLVIYKIA